jgi:uroporphyrinogen decarboxylase
MNKKLPNRRWMSLWRHFYNREKTVSQLTTSMIEWQEKWNWDFMKLNPPACYHVLDWGARYNFFDDEAREPELERPVIISPQDIHKIEPLDPKRGVLGEQLQVIRNLRNHFGRDLPIFETIFSPIEIAHRLMLSREALTSMLKSSPGKLHHLLERLAKTFHDFAIECLQAGADGIFFATKWATSDLMGWKEYQAFGKAYEQPIIDAIQERNAVLILHVCGERTYLPEMLDYRADIFSYDFFVEGALAPEEVVNRTGKFVLGGIDPARVIADPDSVVQDCQRFEQIPKWLAGSSCVITHEATDDAIQKVVRAVRTQN